MSTFPTVSEVHLYAHFFNVFMGHHPTKIA